MLSGNASVKPKGLDYYAKCLRFVPCARSVLALRRRQTRRWRVLAKPTLVGVDALGDRLGAVVAVPGRVVVHEREGSLGRAVALAALQDVQPAAKARVAIADQPEGPYVPVTVFGPK